MRSLIVLLAFLTSPLAAADLAAPALLGPRQTFSLRGFSICPPAGAQAVRPGPPADLRAFSVVDADSGEVRLVMHILQASERRENVLALEDYAPKLVPQLAGDQNFHVDGVPRVVGIAGKPALDLRGTVGGAAAADSPGRRFRRDFWVMTQPNQFLVIQFEGPAARQGQIVQASLASIQTLELFDPAPHKARHEADCRRAETMLSGLSPQRVLSALAREDCWMAVIRDQRVVGFLHFREQPGRQGPQEGLRVFVRSAMLGKDGTRTLTRQELFSSADRRTERWEMFSVMFSGERETARTHQFGLKQHDRLVAQTVVGPHDTQSRDMPVPQAVYLPLAFSPLLPRLLDRSAPGACAFAQYDPAGEELTMRTVRVIGPARVTLGGQSYPAVLLEDQPTLDGPVTRLYVDGAGLPLQLVMDDGAGGQTIIQRTTAEAIRQRFADELQRFEAPRQAAR